MEQPRPEAVLWPISEVAEHSRVSSRTLRHYDALGLLAPAHLGPNGYRWYGAPELRRLQRILLLRRLGLGLDVIGEVLQGQRDELEALRVHRGWLLAEQRRLETLAATVARTIHHLEQGETMNAQDLFEGFDNHSYEEEAIARWGRDTVRAAAARHAALDSSQRQAMAAEAAAINAELARCAAAGLKADDDAVQAAVERHWNWVSFSWTPEATSYVGLGQLYVEDDRFRAFYEKDGVDPEYLLAGMTVYAERRLN
ncbi:MAG: MerR family transcriptional regulator [Micrococcaceae bacterium]|nr:MerR family transcriptional regulator [Micrococcaceae bacterium]